MPTWYYAAVSHITTAVILATIHLKYSCAPTKEAFQLGREKSFAAFFTVAHENSQRSGQSRNTRRTRCKQSTNI